MYERQDASNPRGPPNQLGFHARPKTRIHARFHVRPGSQNMTDASKQRLRRNRIVEREQAVAPSDRVRLITNGSSVKHAVSDQLPVASEENDISRSDLPHFAPLNEKNVARPYGGKHTQAGDFQSQSAERTQNLRSKFALHRVLEFPQINGRLVHDSFRFIMHPLCVAWTFPHDSAEVTKTCS
jgi:hypothetical protein